MAAPAFDPYQYAASEAPAASTAFNPYTYAESPTPAAPVAPTPSPDVPMPSSVFGPVQDWAAGAGTALASGIAGGIAGGYKGLWDLASGKGLSKAASDVQNTEQAVSHDMGADHPMSEDEKIGMESAQSNWDPLNWPGAAAGWFGHKLGGTAESLGAPPIVSEALDIAPTAALSFLPVVKGMGKVAPAEEAKIPKTTTSENPPPPPPPGSPAGAIDVPKGFAQVPKSDEAAEPVPATTADDATRAERKAILESVGLQNMRESALTGNKLNAAAEYQMTRYNQPAGREAADQFDHEMSALSTHAAGIVENTGGTLGMDGEALGNKGAVIDKPFSMAREWFDNQTRNLYAQADARAQGVPVNLDTFNKTLNDDSLMTNQDRLQLRSAIKSYANKLNMTADGPNGPGSVIRGTAVNAETMRKYLNAQWSPQGNGFVNELKNAIDEDVTSAAGQDIYAQARAIRALRGRTLDDPNGISKIFDTDPNTPINRSTPLEKIPQTLTNLSAEQFGNVLEVLRNMPEEIQPQAQAALGEIRGYMANKLLKAGTENKVGGGRATWNGDAVTNILKTDSAKYKLAFQDDPESLAKIQDLNKAGQILKAPTSYPGADAQAANAMKQGLWSRATPGAFRMAGATAGGLFGPIGAGIGEGLGGAAGKALGESAAERAAVKAWRKNIVKAGAP